MAKKSWPACGERMSDGTVRSAIIGKAEAALKILIVHKGRCAPVYRLSRRKRTRSRHVTSLIRNRRRAVLEIVAIGRSSRFDERSWGKRAKMFQLFLKTRANSSFKA